jgi:TonB family protein
MKKSISLPICLLVIIATSAAIRAQQSGIGPGLDWRTYTVKDEEFSVSLPEVDTKARLISKPEPPYTTDARKNNISGTVILKVVFSKTGEVNNIRVVSGLPYGLTKQAIEAARKIKFTPAMKDGKPVSMWMQLEYNFSPTR